MPENRAVSVSILKLYLLFVVDYPREIDCTLYINNRGLEDIMVCVCTLQVIGGLYFFFTSIKQCYQFLLFSFIKPI